MKWNYIYQAIGCPEFISPAHSWVQKENNSLVIGCVSSDKTWKLQCIDNKWLGIIGNCTKRKFQSYLLSVYE